MFGQNDDTNINGSQPGFTPPAPAGNDTVASSSTQPPAITNFTGSLTPPQPPTDNSAAPASPTTAPVAPTADNGLEEPATYQPEPVASDDTTPANTSSDTTDQPSDEASATTGSLDASANDLVRIKQDALQKLSPIVDHLDQTPEERFRTTMMMIQATDDSSKIQDAYDIAQQITDEKVKAQALLDVINEINYFTHQQNEPEATSK